MIRLWGTLLLVSVLVMGIADVARAVIYPPGPGGSCPDTMTITKLQDPTQPCHPASSDTVFGIRGVITAIDSIGGYGLFTQLAGGGAYSGIYVFTGSTNYQAGVPGTPTGGNLFYGDQLAVDGRSLEFFGLTELTDFDNNQGTNDIIIRKTSGTRLPFPTFHIGTPLELDWVPVWTSANGTANQEPWEACLVKVRGPLKCGRTVGAGIGSRATLACIPGGLDTLCIDGFSLTNVAALAVDAPIDSVQGVLSQVIIQGVPSYRILLRNSGDLFAAAPPKVIDAYVVQDGVVRVIFDRPVVPGTAQNTLNYSFSHVDANVVSATLEAGSSSVRVTVTNPSQIVGDVETISVRNIQSTSGLPMSGVESLTFIWGVLTIAEVQRPDSAGIHGSPCRDRSRYATATGGSGTRLTYKGVVTASFGTLYYLADIAGGLRSGMALYSPPQPLTDGHQYVIAGQVQEFDGIGTQIPAGFTEGVNTQFLQDLGAATVPAPVVQAIHTLTDTSCDVNQSVTNAEDYEGMLVTVKGARVTADGQAGQSFVIVGPCPGFLDTITVSNSGNTYTYSPNSLHRVDVTGLLNFRNGALPWRITPRSNADIVDYGLYGFCFPPAGVDSFPTVLHLVFRVPGNEVNAEVIAKGPIWVAHGDPHICSTDGLMTVDTEILDGQMQGQVFGGNVSVVLGTSNGLDNSYGNIKAIPGNPSVAKSGFVIKPKFVFDSISGTSPMGTCISGGVPMLASINNIPPACGTVYRPPPGVEYVFKDCCTGETVTVIGGLIHNDHTVTDVDCASPDIPPPPPPPTMSIHGIKVTGNAVGSGITRLRLVSTPPGPRNCDKTLLDTGPVQVVDHEAPSVTASHLVSAFQTALQAASNCDCNASLGAPDTVVLKCQFALADPSETAICLQNNAGQENLLGVQSNLQQVYEGSINSMPRIIRTYPDPNHPGCLLALGVEPPVRSNPLAGDLRFELSPNPFNPSVLVQFRTSRDGMVTLEVFDSQGRRVEEVVNQWMVAGDHSVAWNRIASNGVVIAPGVYLIRLRSPDGERTRKAINLL